MVQEIVITSDYGIANFIYGFYLLVHFFLWLFILSKTKPMSFEFRKMFNSLSNLILRILSYAWLFVIFYMGRGILMISSSESFMSDKLFIFNIMYFITLFFAVLFLLIVFIKYYGKISGVTDFLRKVVYEVRNE
ncbi:MAG: hypothetical protein ACOC56_02115 [Atribacterota bacterium]